MPVRGLAVLFALFLTACTSLPAGRPREARTAQAPAGPAAAQAIALPTPLASGAMSLEEALARRRSVRAFAATPLTLGELGQLLWAAQGITSQDGRRTAPSAGALYPLELYAVTAEAVYHYEPGGHHLSVHLPGDRRPELYAAALSQAPVLEAPAVLVIAAVYERTERKYGAERSPRYVHLEAGHAAQNILLQAVALDLGAVPVGAFYDDRVQQALGLPADHQPLYLIPVGHPRR
jgi:SagB-type dehydrogenase family enzyme